MPEPVVRRSAVRCSRFGSTRLVQTQSRPQLKVIVEGLNVTGLALDIEPLLVNWSEPASNLGRRVAEVSDELGNVPLVVCTNSRRFSGEAVTVPVLSHARKPFTKLTLLQSLGERPAVVGDLFCLDGLLAMRMGADFVWVREHHPVPLWPRLLTLVDVALVPLLTKTCPSTPESSCQQQTQ